MPTNETSENKVVLDAGAANAALNYVNYDGTHVPILVVPEGYSEHAIDLEVAEPWFGKPVRKRGHFNFADADSFCRYFNEHKAEPSRTFACISDTGATFRGVLNFHGAEPSFNDHSCAFTLQPTHEWLIWTGKAGVKMSQSDFALFLEENREMFQDPDGATLLEIIQNLEGKSNASVNSAIKLPNGELRLTYNEEVTLKGISTTQATDIEMPTLLKVSLAPFHGVSPYPLAARLRYRINDRKLTFWYEPVNAHLVVRAVATDVSLIIEKTTGVQPFKV